MSYVREEGAAFVGIVGHTLYTLAQPPALVQMVPGDRIGTAWILRSDNKAAYCYCNGTAWIDVSTQQPVA